MSNHSQKAVEHLCELYENIGPKTKRGDSDSDDDDASGEGRIKAPKTHGQVDDWSAVFDDLIDFNDTHQSAIRDTTPIGDYSNGTGRYQAWLAEAEQYRVEPDFNSNAQPAKTIARFPGNIVPKDTAIKRTTMGEMLLAFEAWEWLYLLKRYKDAGAMNGAGEQMMEFRFISAPKFRDRTEPELTAARERYLSQLNSGIDRVVFAVHRTLWWDRLVNEPQFVQAPAVANTVEWRYAKGAGGRQREAEHLFRTYVPPTSRAATRAGILVYWVARVYRDAKRTGYLELYPDDADNVLRGRSVGRLVDSLIALSGIGKVPNSFLSTRLDLFVDQVVYHALQNEARDTVLNSARPGSRFTYRDGDRRYSAYSENLGACQGLLNHIWRWHYKPFVDDNRQPSVAAMAVAQIHHIHYGVPATLTDGESRMLAEERYEFLTGALLVQATLDLRDRGVLFAVPPEAANTLQKMEFSPDFAVAAQVGKFWNAQATRVGRLYWTANNSLAVNRLASVAKILGMKGAGLRIQNLPFYTVVSRPASRPDVNANLWQIYYRESTGKVAMRRVSETLAPSDDVDDTDAETRTRTSIGLFDNTMQEISLQRTVYGNAPIVVTSPIGRQ